MEDQTWMSQALGTEKQSLQEEQANSGGHAKQNNLEKGKRRTQEWMQTTQGREVGKFSDQ